jgi:pimeloyl-ACP methyl ester carboxylesterase
MGTITARIQSHDGTGYVETAGQRVRYRVKGEGPPLLMIHGIGAPLEFWSRLEPYLEDFQMITVDPPGTGRSSTPRGRFGMREFAPERVEKLVLASTTCGLGSVPASPKTLAAIASPLRFYSRRHYEQIAPMMYGSRSARIRRCSVSTWRSLIASAVRDRRLEIVQGGSHLCLIQEPDLTSQLIRDFLRD